MPTETKRTWHVGKPDKFPCWVRITSLVHPVLLIERPHVTGFWDEITDYCPAEPAPEFVEPSQRQIDEALILSIDGKQQPYVIQLCLDVLELERATVRAKCEEALNGVHPAMDISAAYHHLKTALRQIAARGEGV